MTDVRDRRIERHFGLDYFLAEVDSNKKLDSAEEAASHASAIEDHMDGSKRNYLFQKFLPDNLRGLQGELKWLSDPANFKKWKKYEADVTALRGYFLSEYLYMSPSRYEKYGSEGKTLGEAKGIRFGAGTYSRVPEGELFKTAYLEPPIPESEALFVRLAEVAGGSEPVIQFLNGLRDAYPEEFNATWWDKFLGYPDTKMIDGRNEGNFTQALSFVVEMVSRPDMLWFIMEIDGILEKSFRFQTAPIYIDYYDRMMAGEDIFGQLKRRVRFTKLLEEVGLADAINEEAMKVVAKLDDATFEDFLKVVDSTGADNFFLHITTLDDFDRINRGQTESQILVDFIELFAKRDLEFMEKAEKLMGLDGVPTLGKTPLYRLADAIENEGGSVQKILGLLGELTKNESRKSLNMVISEDFIVWLYFWPFGRMLDHKGYRDCVPDLAKALVFLDSRADLRQIFRKLDSARRERTEPVKEYDYAHTESGRYLYELDNIIMFIKELRGTELVNTAPEEIKINDRLFWIRHSISFRNFADISALRKGNGSTHYTDTSRIFETMEHDYADVIARGKAIPDADLKRLDKWTDRILDKFDLLGVGLPEDPVYRRQVKKALITQMITLYNAGVPTDTELETFEREALDSYWVKDKTSQSYTAMLFYVRPPLKQLEKYPVATVTLADFLIGKFENEYSVMLYRKWFDDVGFVRRLSELEEIFQKMPANERESLRTLFFRGIIKADELDAPSSDRNYERALGQFITYVDKCIAIIKSADGKLDSFLTDLGDRFPEKGFYNFDAFHTIFKLYAAEGKDRVVRIFDEWEEIGLPLDLYGGEERFLHLSEIEVRHLKKYLPSLMSDGIDPFLAGKDIIGMGDSVFLRFESFLAWLSDEEIKIPFSAVLAMHDIPNIERLMRLLNEHGFVKRFFTPDKEKGITPFGIYAMMRYFKKTGDLKYLSANVDVLTKELRFLRARYDYVFGEFTGGISAEGKDAGLFITTITDLVKWKTGAKDAFFYGVATAPAEEVDIPTGEETIEFHATGAPDIKIHPFKDGDDHDFQIGDYALYTHQATTYTYDEVVSGTDKALLIESLLAQLQAVETVSRRENRLYSYEESASRKSLEAMPLAVLLRVQWLLNNLRDPSFKAAIAEKMKEDYVDASSEYGGYFAPLERREDGIKSLYEKLAIIDIPSARREANKKRIALVQSAIEASKEPKERERLEAELAKLLISTDSGYGMPQSEMLNRLGWTANHHFHSVANMDKDSSEYAGPSKTDMQSAFEFGDGLVITRLEEGKLNIDLYGSYPVEDEDGNIKWVHYVIDLGSYKKS